MIRNFRQGFGFAGLGTFRTPGFGYGYAEERAVKSTKIIVL